MTGSTRTAPENTLQQIIARHFGAVTRRRLERAGVRITGLTTAPDANGSYANGTTVYHVDDNGHRLIMTHTELRKSALMQLPDGYRRV